MVWRGGDVIREMRGRREGGGVRGDGDIGGAGFVGGDAVLQYAIDCLFSC